VPSPISTSFSMIAYGPISTSLPILADASIIAVG